MLAVVETHKGKAEHLVPLGATAKLRSCLVQTLTGAGFFLEVLDVRSSSFGGRGNAEAKPLLVTPTGTREPEAYCERTHEESRVRGGQ